MQVNGENCSVTIYEHDNHGYPQYTLCYYKDGKRKREVSNDFLAMRSRADEVVEDLDEGRTDPTAMKASVRNDCMRALEHLKPTGQAIDLAAKHYARAYEITGRRFRN